MPSRAGPSPWRCAIPPGQWVAGQLPPGLLMMGIGGLVLLALAAILVLRGRRLFHGTGGAVAAGALSGFMNVTAGVGGPAMTLYALGTGWEHRRFVGSMQLYFALLNAGSIAAKGLPHLPAGQCAAIAAALVIGIGAGMVAARQIPPAQARAAVTVLALVGAGASVIKGWSMS
jgi:uncharacterized membrane protein YfcA